MIENFESLALLLTVALVPVGLLLVGLHSRMLRMLRIHHRDVWESLGSPRLWFSKTVTETIKTLRFLWRGDYRLLGDKKLSTLCGSVRALFFTFSALIIGAGLLLTVVAYHELGFAD